jgi:hypothetical protein
MKTGPKSGSGAASNGDDRNYVQKATDAWGDVPDWVNELAQIADQVGQKKAAEAIGYSNGLVSQVINRRYAGDMDGVEQRVRGALMGLKVDCPILGPIGRDRCLQEQKEPFRATSAFRAQIFHACRNGCPNARPKGGKNAE